ncbi:hypothetical protein NCAS_0D04800 [Naumovozyma castellii]|uniref:Uncharacterized protein n=1 Tax=Naumovozyma castellii TaxID=27288 RepID=G0VES0_NAUCA|nr:hypothetical protein NCAS_0D04800 [Naumovozyma castellii CBS 4309]CCC70061.1 hypothetical protein NCAS_0D04800 [Naumovozyma castellii CBS 4309]
MTISQVTHDSMTEFQAKPVEENIDYAALMHHKLHLERKLEQQRHFTQQLHLLYAELGKSHNYDEFINVLTENRPLLREIFTLEGSKMRNRTLKQKVDVDWSKYGLDISEYICDNEELWGLFEDGLL